MSMSEPGGEGGVESLPRKSIVPSGSPRASDVGINSPLSFAREMYCCGFNPSWCLHGMQHGIGAYSAHNIGLFRHHAVAFDR
jgi:hypothetical protein